MVLDEETNQPVIVVGPHEGSLLLLTGDGRLYSVDPSQRHFTRLGNYPGAYGGALANWLFELSLRVQFTFGITLVCTPFVFQSAGGATIG